MLDQLFGAYVDLLLEILVELIEFARVEGDAVDHVDNGILNNADFVVLGRNVELKVVFLRFEFFNLFQ